MRSRTFVFLMMAFAILGEAQVYVGGAPKLPPARNRPNNLKGRVAQQLTPRKSGAKQKVRTKPGRILKAK